MFWFYSGFVLVLILLCFAFWFRFVSSSLFAAFRSFGFLFSVSRSYICYSSFDICHLPECVFRFLLSVTCSTLPVLRYLISVTSSPLSVIGCLNSIVRNLLSITRIWYLYLICNLPDFNSILVPFRFCSGSNSAIFQMTDVRMGNGEEETERTRNRKHRTKTTTEPETKENCTITEPEYKQNQNRTKTEPDLIFTFSLSSLLSVCYLFTW